MEPFFVYLLKSSSIILLFLASYHLFLKRETFFTSNRLFLVVGILIALLLPLITITKSVYVELTPTTIVEMATNTETIAIDTNTVQKFDWVNFLFTIYLLGMAYFTFKLLFQLYTIQRIKRQSNIISEGRFFHVRTLKRIAPFSFFKYIFYYPKQFAAGELDTILSHEKVHARELHSIDILLIEIMFIVQWFNPAIWFYRAAIKQNLEFLADSKTCTLAEDKKRYQYLMLQQAVKINNIAIVNPFFNSIIKKRIVMLNQKQSRKINKLKLFLVLPLLAGFVLSFNTREVVKFSEDTTATVPLTKAVVDFTSPLRQQDIKKITSGFGMARDPETKELKFHNGIDLVAQVGKEVMATADGKITTSAQNSVNGNYVIIQHEDGYSSKYLHLNGRNVNAGDPVVLGATIGYVGSTGKSTGPHLHFEILKFGQPINPASVIPFKAAPKLATKQIVNQVTKQPPPTPKKMRSVKTVELTINKDTSDEELEKMKNDLNEDAIDFSYTVVRNDDREIIDISLQVSGTNTKGESFSGNYRSNSEGPISSIFVLYDDDANVISIGAAQQKYYTVQNNTFSTEVWDGLDEIGEHDDIVVIEQQGSKKIYLNGNEIDQDSLEQRNSNIVIVEDTEEEDVRIHLVTGENETKRIRVKRQGSKGSNDVTIIKDSDGDANVTIGRNKGFLVVNADREGDPLYIVDGKEATAKYVRRLSRRKIERIEVLKGKSAKKKYGRKAKNGVIEITTKCKN
ncbi:MAG: peptidoglycan DD-metalloendopeptidase family protein [Bacteroidota bacterium]